MFVFRDKDLPADFTFPKDLEGLGFFINGKDQIRKIENPEEGFQYRVNRNERYNVKRRESFNECIRQIVLGRLRELGLNEHPLPGPRFFTKFPLFRRIPDIAVAPILMTDNLHSAKRIVVVVGDPGQDLGIWSYRAIGEDGINAGSMVDFAKAVLGTGENKISDVALVIANTGQLLYNWAKGKAMTLDSWNAADRPTVVCGQPTLTTRNKILASHNWENHVASVFLEYILNAINYDTSPLIDVIGMAEGGLAALKFLKTNWTTWAPLVTGIALGAPLQNTYDGDFNPKETYDNGTFSSFLAHRGRSYVLHRKRIGRYVKEEWSVNGCKTYSCGEELNRDGILRRAWPDIMDWFDLLHRDPLWCEDLSSKALELAAEDSDSDLEDDWDRFWDPNFGELAGVFAEETPTSQTLALETISLEDRPQLHPAV